MTALPSGTVTLFFTDVEGSTRLLQELGRGYEAALAEHHRIVRRELDRHDGCEVDTQGEAFFAAFARASDAVAAAVDVQRAFGAHPFRVRIGVHTGEIIPHRRRDGHCPRCGNALARDTIGGRTAYWCPRCQP